MGSCIGRCSLVGEPEERLRLVTPNVNTNGTAGHLGVRKTSFIVSWLVMASGPVKELEELEKEYLELEVVHKDYCKKVDEVKSIQKKCMSSISHQRYRMKQIIDSIKRVEKNASAEDREGLQEVKTEIEHKKNQYRDLEEVLPHENGVYLKVILGSVNVSLLSKSDKYKYKEDYEIFKLWVTILSLVLVIMLMFIEYRVTDAVFQFLLVWYYCTLTIREHILIVNGSRIKGWWLSHHFISTACAGIILIWPDGETYKAFRYQFVMYSLYLSLVQLMQYHYQKGCLYRLRAMGERHKMDLTIEGFQSWMWKGLSFLLPFLVVGYIFQLYNAYALYLLSRAEMCTEWQVLTLAIVFFILFLGNTLTTVAVVRHKLTAKLKSVEFRVKHKYRFSNNKSHDQ
ncbi:hypothetical protein LSH36_108g03061 [Paralvinella palmiformis]|uniref:Transmembrane protein 120 homolog n=1 Tax=Paralvinella palmiformis TaxID=53620 RepID=A0AAD9N9B6_9ANNE|nr:hypothetical protein LSH36_108g03061 [Paralvinella palmiformis]